MCAPRTAVGVLEKHKQNHEDEFNITAHDWTPLWTYLAFRRYEPNSSKWPENERNALLDVAFNSSITTDQGVSALQMQMRLKALQEQVEESSLDLEPYVLIEPTTPSRSNSEENMPLGRKGRESLRDDSRLPTLQEHTIHLPNAQEELVNELLDIPVCPEMLHDEAAWWKEQEREDQRFLLEAGEAIRKLFEDPEQLRLGQQADQTIRRLVNLLEKRDEFFGIEEEEEIHVLDIDSTQEDLDSLGEARKRRGLPEDSREEEIEVVLDFEDDLSTEVEMEEELGLLERLTIREGILYFSTARPARNEMTLEACTYTCVLARNAPDSCCSRRCLSSLPTEEACLEASRSSWRPSFRPRHPRPLHEVAGGIPLQRRHSDNGPAFVSEIFRHHPQGNGIAEAFMKPLAHGLADRHLIQQQGRLPASCFTDSIPGGQSTQM
eukprot:GHVQ01012194.1.p1 GENE.GHVQ01012194.1~~GHVQ01012194.1.p1  ORF type:complete len:436 (+),score=44.47 GHVQ01012194.1:2731-4038(+)